VVEPGQVSPWPGSYRVITVSDDGPPVDRGIIYSKLGIVNRMGIMKYTAKIKFHSITSRRRAAAPQPSGASRPPLLRCTPKDRVRGFWLQS